MTRYSGERYTNVRRCESFSIDITDPDEIERFEALVEDAEGQSEDALLALSAYVDEHGINLETDGIFEADEPELNFIITSPEGTSS